MSLHPAVAEAADTIRVRLGLYRIPDERAQEDLDWLFRSLPAVFMAVAAAKAGVAGTIREDTPVSNSFADFLGDAARDLGHVSDMAEDLYRRWREVHADDLRAVEEPGPNQTIMNV